MKKNDGKKDKKPSAFSFRDVFGDREKKPLDEAPLSGGAGVHYFDEFDEIDEIDEIDEFDNFDKIDETDEFDDFFSDPEDFDFSVELISFDDPDDLEFSVEPVSFNDGSNDDAPEEEVLPAFSELQDFNVSFESETLPENRSGEVFSGSDASGGNDIYSGFDDSVFDADDLEVEITAEPACDSDDLGKSTGNSHEKTDHEERFYDEADLGKIVFGDRAPDEFQTPAEDTHNDGQEASKEKISDWQKNIFRDIEDESYEFLPGRDAGNAAYDEPVIPTDSETDTKAPEPTVLKKSDTFRRILPSRKKLARQAKAVAVEVAKWSLTGVVVFFIICLANIYLLRFSMVSGHSMDPTLYDGETIMLSKLPYIFGEIEYGDIIVIDREENRERTFFVEFCEVFRYSFAARLFFSETDEEDVFWVKRVIGVEGDVISFENGKLYRNGEVVEEPYLYTQNIMTYPNIVFTVGEGELFVMGDNRNNSLDSRYLTVPIKEDHVVGKVVGLKS